MQSLLIEVKKNGEAESGFMVYGKGSEDDISLSSICYIDDYPDIDEDDDYNETFPNFVISNNLELWYRDQIIIDVIDNILDHDKGASCQQILDALIFYSNNDSFLF